MYSTSILKITQISPHRRCSSIIKERFKPPKYPDILDVSSKATEERKRFEKYRRIGGLKTVEEKLFAQNLDKYYGWNAYLLNEEAHFPNFLPFVKHITQTKFEEVNKKSFHEAQGLNLDECQELLSRIRPHLQEELLFEIKGKAKTYNHSEGEDRTSPSNSLIHLINRCLLTYFSDHYPHFLECMVDYEPRVEAFWTVGGFHPSPEEYNERLEKEKLSKEEKEKSVEHYFQYAGNPVSQVRSALPLSLPEDIFSHLADSSSSIPEFPYDPQVTFGITKQRRHVTNIPGFWPGDKNEFILLSYNLMNGRSENLSDLPEPSGDAVHSQGILTSFASLLSQASYQGFTPFSDLTYPLFHQAVLTDGRLYSFYLYQMNTTLHNSHALKKNPRENYCIALPPSALYQDIQGSEFVGWNDDVLSSLLSCYLNRPRVKEGVDLKPYLDKEETIIADIKDAERRAWLHSQFRHMYSLRPRHKLPYEIYDWERIYKIKFQTRPVEARTRPFELEANPLEERKYYEHAHPYIPRAFRTRKKHWTNWRAKRAKTYYPEV